MEDKIIKIASYDDYLRAEIAKIALESEDIKCFLGGENFVATYWLYANIDGGIKLYVKESDRQKAEAILKAMHETEETDKDADYDLRCPNCNSSDIDNTQRSKWVSIMLILGLAILTPFLLIWGSPLAVFRNAYQCKNCGHKWKREKEASQAI